MESIDELKNTLREITGIADKDLSVLDKICSVKHFKKKELFLKPGSTPVYSGYVTQGAFREYYTNQDGREYNKVFCFKGDFTGSYYDLHRQKPSLITIEALTDSTVILIDHKAHQKLVESDVFWLKISLHIAHNLLMKKFEKELQLLTLTAAERYELLRTQHPQLEQLVPAYHIASFLGITPDLFKPDKGTEEEIVEHCPIQSLRVVKSGKL